MRIIIFVFASLLLAGCASAPPAAPADFAITNVTVIDTATGKAHSGRTVSVRDGRIAGVVDGGDRVAAETVVDGTGKFLMPALADMHVHLRQPSHLPLYVANGVTLVRDMWGSPDRLAMREAAKREPRHPAIVAGSPGIDGMPPTFDGEPAVESPEQARALVREFKQAGYDFIKIYDRLDAPQLAAILDEAAVQGLPVAGHAPFPVPLRTTLASGVKSLEHGQLYLFEYLDASVELPAGPFNPQATFPALGAAAGRAMAEGRPLSTLFDPAKRAAFAADVAKSGVVTTPTLISLINANSPAAERAERLQRPEVRALDAATLARWGDDNFRFKMMPDPMLAMLREMGRQFMPFVADLDAAGGKFLVGSDAPEAFVVPGHSLHEELTLLVEAGLTPARVLKAATVDAADYLDRSDWGRIAAGAEADFVLLSANPLDDIHATRGIVGVANDGIWMPRGAPVGAVNR